MYCIPGYRVFPDSSGPCTSYTRAIVELRTAKLHDTTHGRRLRVSKLRHTVEVSDEVMEQYNLNDFTFSLPIWDLRTYYSHLDTNAEAEA